MNPEYDRLYKILVIGDCGCGKNTLIARYCNVEIDPETKKLPSDNAVRTINVHGTVVKLQVWKHSEGERFRTVTSSLYRGVQAIIVIYSVNDLSSWSNVKQWLQEVDRYAGENVIKVIAANNIDQKRYVDEQVAEEFAAGLGIQHIHISALTGEKVDHLFFCTAEAILMRQLDSIDEVKTSPTQVVVVQTKPKKTKEKLVSTFLGLFSGKKKKSKKPTNIIENIEIANEFTKTDEQKKLIKKSADNYNKQLFENLNEIITKKDLEKFKNILTRIFAIILPTEPINNYGDTILHACTRTHDKLLIIEFCAWWYANHKNFSNIPLPGVWKNSMEDTALHVLCARLEGNDSIFLEFFLEEVPGIDIRSRNCMNCTCLTICADRGPDALPLLLILLSNVQQLNISDEIDWDNFIDSSIQSEIHNDIKKFIPVDYVENKKKIQKNKNQMDTNSLENQEKLIQFIYDKNINEIEKIILANPTDDLLNPSKQGYCLLYELVRVGDFNLFKNILFDILPKTDYFKNYLNVISNNNIWLNCIHIAISLQHFDFIDCILFDICKNQLQLSKDIFLALMDVHRSAENSQCVNCFVKLLDYAKENFDNEFFENLFLASQLLYKIVISKSNDQFFYSLLKQIKKESLVDFITSSYNNDGLSVIHVAVLSGNFEITKELLNLVGPEKFFIPETKLKNTVFHLAVFNNNSQDHSSESESKAASSSKDNRIMLEFLHSTYCAYSSTHDSLISPYDIINKQNNDGNTPLFIAVKNQMLDCIEFLLKEKADPTIKDNREFTCIHVASLCASSESLSLLLNNSSVSSLKDSFRSKTSIPTPLHLVAMSRIENLHSHVQILLEKNANIDAKDIHGATAIHSACKSGNTSALRALLNYHSGHGGNNEKIQAVNIELHLLIDSNNDTPLHVAITSRHEELALELFEALSKEQKVNIFKVKNKLDKNILHLALNQNLEKISKILFDFYKLFFTPTDFWPGTLARKFYFSLHPLPHLVPEFDIDQIIYKKEILQTPSRFLSKGLLLDTATDSSANDGEAPAKGSKIVNAKQNIKVVIKASFSSENQENHEKEIMLLSMLDHHRGVVPLLGVVEFKNQKAKAIVLAHVGHPICDTLAKLPPNEETFKMKVQLAIQIGKIISYLHTDERTKPPILHGDLRLDNILFHENKIKEKNNSQQKRKIFKRDSKNDSGSGATNLSSDSSENYNLFNIYLIDFEESIVFPRSTSGKPDVYDYYVTNHSYFNFPQWKSLEYLDNKLSISLKSDSYSFAMILYELFTNSSPFEREQFKNYSEITLALQQGKRPTIPEALNLPPLLLQIIEKSWDSDDKKRLKIDEILIKLECLLQSRNSSSIMQVPAIENHVIDELSSYFPSEIWINPFFHSKTVQQVEPLLCLVINFCFKQFLLADRKPFAAGKLMSSMRLICKHLVWWARVDDCKPSIIIHPHGLKIFQYIQNCCYGLFNERERLHYYPFTRIENVIIDRSKNALLGTGSFGKVYRMKMAAGTSSLPVAVKIIQYDDPEAVAREITVLSLLKHPNLIHLYGTMFQFDQNECSLVMELADYEIMDYVKKFSSPLPTRLSLLKDSAKAIEFLAFHKLLHRDIKAPNVFVVLDKNNNNLPVAKLGDMGCIFICTGSLTTPSGTMVYMAPEILPKESRFLGMEIYEPCVSSDIYSFGCLMFEVLACIEWVDLYRKRPTATHVDIEVQAMSILTAQQPPLPKLLLQTVKACWNIQPSRRPTAKNIVEILSELLQENN